MRAQHLLGVRPLAGPLVAGLLAACGDPAPQAQAGAAPGADTLSLAERRAIPGVVAFVSERHGAPDVYLVRPTGDGERRLTDHPAADFPAAVAPDGSALLVVRAEEVEGGLRRERLLLQPLPAGPARQLGPLATHVRNPEWSADGRWIAFESDAASFRDLYRVDRSGAELRRLTTHEAGSYEPRASPDGQWLAFVSSRDGDAELYRMRPDGTGAQRLTAFHRDDAAPRWSPDGRSIAFVSNREGLDRVFVMAPDGTLQRRLGSEGAFEEIDPVWSPDGRFLLVTRRDSLGASSLWREEVATGARHRVAEEGTMPAWSPDGRHIAYTARHGAAARVVLARADGSAPTPLTRPADVAWLPRWVPSGAAVPVPVPR